MPDALNCTDPIAFFSEELRIWNKSNKLVPFVPNPVQRHYLENRTQHNLVLKARQVGLSSCELGRNYFVVTRQFGHRVLTVAHRDTTSRVLLERVRQFYRYQDPAARPPASHLKETEISFDDMGSSFRVMTAGGDSAGIGTTVTDLHVSELPFWPGDPDSQLKGMLAAVPPEGSVTIESTPNARGDLFHTRWLAAKAGRSEYRCFFYPWWWMTEYQMGTDHPNALPADRRSPLEYTAEEARLVLKEGLKEEQVRWRRWARQEHGKDYPKMYPEDDISCFLHAGRPRFDQEQLEKMVQQSFKPIQELENGAIRVYGWPCPGHYYAVAGDPASGMEISTTDTDDSAFHIMDLHTNDIVVSGGQKWEPSTFARILNDWGRKYNGAFLGVERNNHGTAVLNVLEEQLYYPNLYYPNSDFHGNRPVPGWTTTQANKYMAEAELDDALRSWGIRLQDRPTLDQLMGYQRRADGKTGAVAGEHDDLVSALVILWQMRKYAPLRSRAEPVLFSAAERGLVGV